MMQSQPMTNILKALWELLVQICVQRKKNLESEIEVQQQQDTYPFWKSQTRIYASASGTFCSMQTPHYWKVSPVFRAGYSPENLLTHMPTHWNHPHRPDHQNCALTVFQASLTLIKLISKINLCISFFFLNKSSSLFLLWIGFH